MFEDFFARSKTAKISDKNIDPLAVEVQNAVDLLADEHSQAILRRLKALMSLPKGVPSYDDLCSQVLTNYAEFVQMLPQSEIGAYAKPGGLLERSLERAYLSAEKCRKFFKTGENETLSPNHAMWMYVVFTAALFFQIGFSILKLQVTLIDAATKGEEKWEPFQGSMIGKASHYKYQFEKSNRYLQSRTVTVLLARQLMPAAGFFWIAADRDVFDVWLALLNEEWNQVGSFINLIPASDAEALSKRLFNKDFDVQLPTLSSPLEFLPEDFSLKKYSENRERSLAAAMSENLSLKQTPKEGMEGAHQDAGTAFVKWLRESVAAGQISVNGERSPIHVLRDGALLIYPTLLAMFIRLNPQFGNSMQQIMNKVTELGIIRADVNGNHVHLFTMGQPDNPTVVKAMILNNPHMVFMGELPPLTKVMLTGFQAAVIPDRTPAPPPAAVEPPAQQQSQNTNPAPIKPPTKPG